MKLIEYPNKILRKPVKKVEVFDKNLKKIVESMKKIMIKEYGVGLSANQVGLDLSLFIAKPKEKFYVFINPKIIDQKNEEIIKEEGCLSIKNKFGIVKRYKEVKIMYQDLKGKFHTLKAKGILSHIIQHEIDHLNGILFIDKAIEIYNLYKND